MVIAAATLKEALRLARNRHGDEARVINSRTVVRRQRGGLGQERIVEVLIDPGDGRSENPAGPLGRRPAPSPGGVGPTGPTPPLDASLVNEIVQEVGRIEGLVDSLSGAQEELLRKGAETEVGPVGELWLAAGATTRTVTSLLTRYVSETGGAVDDRAALSAYLQGALGASSCSWAEMGGCHVFLGPEGCGKTEMVLAAAAELQACGQNSLVLSLLPRHGGDVRRLQQAASRHGFDAAILKKEEQLESSAAHLDGYDTVLIDTPGIFHPSLRRAGTLHDQIVQNAGFHRHLVVPMDVDLHDCAPLWEAGRAWNCDWLAVSRSDLSARYGKLMDMVEALPLPISFLGRGPWPDGRLGIAGGKELVQMIMVAGEAARRRDTVAGAEA